MAPLSPPPPPPPTRLCLEAVNTYCFPPQLACSQLARWLGAKAEALGVEIFAGFPASELLYRGEAVRGVATSDMGIAKDGSQKDSFTPGVELQARVTLMAEGCRGSLSEVTTLSLYPALTCSDTAVVPELISLHRVQVLIVGVLCVACVGTS